MLYWKEIINDLTKPLTRFCSKYFKFIWRSYKCSVCEPFVTWQISILQSNSVQTDLSISCQQLQQLLWCQGCWRGADVMTECLETNFHLSSMLLRKLCVHYANGFDNVESVYFIYSNSVHPQYRYCWVASEVTMTPWWWQWLAETCWGKSRMTQ
jgi:hypothetical protein